jgi:ribosomal protein L32
MVGKRSKEAGIMTCWRCSEVATHFMQDVESGIVFPYCERHAKEYEGHGLPIYPIAGTVTAKRGAFTKFVKRRRRQMLGGENVAAAVGALGSVYAGKFRKRIYSRVEREDLRAAEKESPVCEYCGGLKLSNGQCLDCGALERKR